MRPGHTAIILNPTFIVQMENGWSNARPKAHNKRGKHAGGVAMYIKDKYAKQMTLVATDARNDRVWVNLYKAVDLGEDL
jgi:hypothetical protein